MAKQGGRVVLHGHGTRVRSVVASGHAEIGWRRLRCWVRRYRCRRCASVVSVLPPGVLLRHLYSLIAIVRAFVLATAEPVGQGVDHATAYACQGRLMTTTWTKPWSYRWRSLERWRSRISTWWPGRAVRSPHALLAGFIAEAGDDLEAILGRATASHVLRGSVM